ncbi:MAG: DEAD/DEAH box helicase [bacterium JZ-2024 1]
MIPGSEDRTIKIEVRDGRLAVRLPLFSPAALQQILRECAPGGYIVPDRFWKFHRETHILGFHLEPTKDAKSVIDSLAKGYLLTLKTRVRSPGVYFEFQREALDPRIRELLAKHTTEFGTVRKVEALGNLIRRLQDLGAHIVRTPDADAYLAKFREKNLVELSMRGKDIAVTTGPAPRKAILRVLEKFPVQNGTLGEPLFLKPLLKALKAEGAIAEITPAVETAYSAIASARVSLVASRFFYQQIQVLYDRKYLKPALLQLVVPYLDEFDLLKDPRDLEQLVTTLKERGAVVGVEPHIQNILQKRAEIARGDLGSLPLKLPPYPFQAIGALFLAINQSALLADEMGLGKTVQALSAFLYLRNRGLTSRALVLCPASLKYQWATETVKFTDLKAVVIEGTPGQRRIKYREPADLYILNYELLLRDIDDIRLLANDLIILDEAQRIKNYQTKTSKLIRVLPKKYAFALTGTPLENELLELYNVMRFINPEVLGSNVQKFISRYVIKNHWGGIKAYRNVEEVRARVRAIVLRRTKKEVYRELPERIDNQFFVELSQTQNDIYREYKTRFKNLLRRGLHREQDVLEAFGILTYLREICDSSELVAADKPASSKLDELKRVLPEIISGGHKVLLFSEWEKMTAILERDLSDLGIQMVRFYGDLSQKQRADVIKQFMENEETKLFISTDAGSLGLNLQAADYVIHFDLPYNPARLEQRIARAHRIGQSQPVNNVYFLTPGTIEMGIRRILYRKQRLFADIFDKLETPAMLARTPDAMKFFEALLAASEE